MGTDVDAITRTPCPFTARARRGDEVVAESTGAVSVEVPDRPPVLFFPVADVRLDCFRDEGRTATGSVGGLKRFRSMAGPDGRDLLWSYADPPPELRWLSGLAAFDQERVMVELVETGAGGDLRHTTVTRFPPWGDAADLIDMLDVRREAPGRYVSVSRHRHRHLRSVVEGSQILAQCLVAAGRQYPGRRAVSAQMVFPRAADTARALQFTLAEISSGRSFTTLTVEASQSDRRCASGVFLLDATAPDVVRHTTAAPDVPGPYESVPLDMSVTGRDIRVVDGAYTDDPDAPTGPPVLDAWVRFRHVPADPYLHAGLLAQFTGHMSIAAALRPHRGVGQREAHRTLSTAVNAISLSLHADIRADRWMLYHHVSTFAGDGMTHAQCRVHDEEGHMLASFTVDAIVRRFPPGHAAPDEETAL